MTYDSYDFCGGDDERRKQQHEAAKKQLMALVDEILTKVDCIEVEVTRQDEYFGKDVLHTVAINCVYPG
jgi:hypothetical protein